ncbi:MAG: archaellin/type IV pilin N-terminal domain-containing protein [Thermoproteota archaeon]
MNLIRKGHRQSHRGVIGVESAIVMIAFVIVAAALAFVVLNMGFSTTQKAKTTIVSGLGEASSSLEVGGKVTGFGCTSSSSETACGTTPLLNVTTIPLRIASGGESIDLSSSTASVKYLSNTVQYDNIYAGPITAAEYVNATQAFTQATAESGSAFDAFNNAHPIEGAAPSSTKAIIYWSVRSNTNSILDQGEHAVLAIAYSTADRPAALDKIRTEIVVPTGAALTVERQVPNITNLVVDMG